jgi:ABC-type multidrug transport system ATPase subunit
VASYAGSLVDFVAETETLTGGYGVTMVLRELSLRLPQASIYGFLGPNGAGKTTALRMLLGLLRPVRGEVRLFGQTLPAALPGVLRRVGSLIEQPSLYEHLTGRENLEIARRLKGLDRSACEEPVAALEIGDYVDHPVDQYSRGMRQRLGVAIAALGNPELLLLDEPMNGLDAGGLEAFRRFLRQLREEHGTTVLVSSHQLDELDLMATHIGILSGMGDLLFQGTRAELSARAPQELVIQVDRREEAMRVLASSGHEVDGRREGLVIHGATQETARTLNRLLVENGVGVHHLAVELATLEALFQKVTRTARAGNRG